jgi:flagellar basal-body rod modification protein FlgD
MSTVNPISSASTAAAPAASTSVTGASSAEQQDRFLKMLIAQMKNQDPTNPMDNAQVTSQMAQISTVTGIGQLNDTMKAVAAQFSGMETLQGASLAGRQVLVPGNAINLAGGAAQGGFKLAAAASQVSVSVTNGAGQVVHTANLGALAAGQGAFEWDGMTDGGTAAADGAYTFTVKATNNGQPVDASTLAYARVMGVSSANGALSVDLGAQGRVALADIQQIR